MKGRARAAQSEYDLAVSQAWHGEAFARAKKLKSLSEYLPKGESSQSIPPEAILDAMMTMKAHGVPMDIRKLN